MLNVFHTIFSFRKIDFLRAVRAFLQRNRHFEP